MPFDRSQQLELSPDHGSGRLHFFFLHSFGTLRVILGAGLGYTHQFQTRYKQLLSCTHSLTYQPEHIWATAAAMGWIQEEGHF